MPTLPSFIALWSPLCSSLSWAPDPTGPPTPPVLNPHLGRAFLDCLGQRDLGSPWGACVFGGGVGCAEWISYWRPPPQGLWTPGGFQDGQGSENKAGRSLHPSQALRAVS